MILEYSQGFSNTLNDSSMILKYSYGFSNALKYSQTILKDFRD